VLCLRSVAGERVYGDSHDCAGIALGGLGTTENRHFDTLGVVEHVEHGLELVEPQWQLM
jgi:hypothetical protein